MSEFADRHVLVTGASSGIGLAAARMLAERGARVSLIARSGTKLAEAAAAIGRAGGTAAYAVADVADRGALLAAMEQAERAFGPVAGLFANAGTGGRFAPLREYDDEVFEAVLHQPHQRLLGDQARAAGDARAPARQHRGDGSPPASGGMPHNVAYVASSTRCWGWRAAAAPRRPAQRARELRRARFHRDADAHAAGCERRTAGDPRATGCRRAAGAHRHGGGARELVCFLLSDRAAHITGQSLAVDGGILGTLIPR